MLRFEVSASIFRPVEFEKQVGLGRQVEYEVLVTVPTPLVLEVSMVGQNLKSSGGFSSYENLKFSKTF